MYEVKTYGELLLLIKYGFGNTCYPNRLQMLDLSPHCLDFYVWYARPIDILSHSDILLQDWNILQNFIINCMEDSLYRLTVQGNSSTSLVRR